MQTVIENLLSKEVSRKEFLAMVVSGLVAVVGVSAFLNRLGGATQSHQSAQSYGASPYGGAKSAKM